MGGPSPGTVVPVNARSGAVGPWPGTKFARPIGGLARPRTSPSPSPSSPRTSCPISVVLPSPCWPAIISDSPSGGRTLVSLPHTAGVPCGWSKMNAPPSTTSPTSSPWIGGALLVRVGPLSFRVRWRLVPRSLPHVSNPLGGTARSWPLPRYPLRLVTVSSAVLPDLRTHFAWRRQVVGGVHYAASSPHTSCRSLVRASAPPQRTQRLRRHKRHASGAQHVHRGVAPVIHLALRQRRVRAAARPRVAAATVQAREPPAGAPTTT